MKNWKSNRNEGIYHTATHFYKYLPILIGIPLYTTKALYKPKIPKYIVGTQYVIRSPSETLMVYRCERVCTSIRYSLSSVFENWDILEFYWKKTPKPLYRRIQYIHSMHKLPRLILYYWSYNLNNARKLRIAYTWLRSWISWMNWSYVSDLSSVTVENLLVIWSTTERARLRIINPALIWFCPIFQLWCYLDNKDKRIPRLPYTQVFTSK